MSRAAHHSLPAKLECNPHFQAVAIPATGVAKRPRCLARPALARPLRRGQPYVLQREGCCPSFARSCLGSVPLQIRRSTWRQVSHGARPGGRAPDCFRGLIMKLLGLQEVRCWARSRAPRGQPGHLAVMIGRPRTRGARALAVARVLNPAADRQAARCALHRVWHKVGGPGTCWQRPRRRAVLQCRSSGWPP